jgi:hypothetical protein
MKTVKAFFAIEASTLRIRIFANVSYLVKVLTNFTGAK